MNPTMMGALMDLILPSSQFVEKASYGDPLFRMPPSGTGGYIPITADKEYAAEAAGLIPVAAPGAKKASDVASKIVREIQNQPPVGAIGPRVTKFGDVSYDQRFDPRIKEQPRIKETTTTVDETVNLDVPAIPLTQFEGYPFITSMSDRTAAGGLLTSINDVALKRPVRLGGGQDFMFENPFVWASAKGPVKQIMNQAQVLREVTGKDPLYMPWRMAPTGGDFATMTGETMLSYAESALPKSIKKQMDKEIKKIVPDWKGIDSPESIKQYQSFSDANRKKIKQTLDVEFRDVGGLNIGQARLAVSDPKQLGGFDAQIMNIGRIFADKPMIEASGHASYPKGVPGEGLGRVDKDINIFQLLPKVVEERGIPSATSPRQTDIRALQMKPYAGILDEETLRLLGY
jgi:hypothetical protein